MVMIAHQDIGMDFDVEPLGELPEKRQEQMAVIIRTIYIPAAITARHDMVKRTGIFYSPLAGHDRILYEAELGLSRINQ
jgi:hypothetical protein